MWDFKHKSFVVVGLIIIGVVIGVVLNTNFNVDSKTLAVPASHIYTEARDSSDDSANQTLNAVNFNPNSMFVDIVKKVRPTIVSIYTTKNVKVQRDPFFFFFREFRGMPDDENHQRDMKQQGLGSGIIISADGYIITNNHVIEDVDELKVKLVDNREFVAKVMGSDPSTEIALVKIDAKDLPVAVLGSSENLQIGEWVMAVGSPLDLTSTVTAGIISALSRDINIIGNQGSATSIEDFIQTDAAINPGNSGGALVNLKGDVIGVNTAIATRTNYYMGYGFAVPINIAKSVVNDIMEFGEVRRGYLGVYIAAVDPVTAKGVKLDKPQGVFITSVIEGGSGDKAGIKEGDVILSVNGVEVNQPNELQAKVGTYNPGDEIKLEVWRTGKKMNFTAVLQGQKSETKTVLSNKKGKEESLPNLGLKVKDLTAAEAKQMEVDEGIVVVSVDPYGAAARARVARGDIVLELNGQKVKSVDDFYDKIAEFKSGDVVRLKLRNRQNQDVFDRLIFLEINK